jgi:hypothetical protein
MFSARFFGVLAIMSGLIAMVSGLSLGIKIFGNMASVGGFLWIVLGIYMVIKGGNNRPFNY